MISNGSHSSGGASNPEDDDATLLLASASLGDWLGLSTVAAGREGRVAEASSWWGAGAGSAAEAGAATAPGVDGTSPRDQRGLGGGFDLGGGWGSSLGFALMHDAGPTVSAAPGLPPPPGFALNSSAAAVPLPSYSSLPFGSAAQRKDHSTAVAAPPGFDRPATAPFTTNPWAQRR